MEQIIKIDPDRMPEASNRRYATMTMTLIAQAGVAYDSKVSELLKGAIFIGSLMAQELMNIALKDNNIDIIIDDKENGE
jgi:hypothetical protein